jgi:monoamine oxidase
MSGAVWRKGEGQWKKEGDFVQDYSALNKKLKQLKEDIPVAQFIEKYLNGAEEEATAASLRSYTEGYNAADTASASTFAMRRDLEESDEEQYHIEGGYQTLVEYLISEVKGAGASIHYFSPVDRVEWQKNSVIVTSGNQQWQAKKVLVTVPLGVLQKGAFNFTPSVPQITNAARALGFGGVIKIVLQFNEAFWENKANTDGKDFKGFGFLLSEETVPTWWTQGRGNTTTLAGWLAGPNANRLKDLTDEAILEEGLKSLSRLFTIPLALLKEKLSASHVANWIKDIYCYGGYSFTTVGEAAHKKVLKDGVENTLFFAGEALFEGIEIGTVEAALQSGRDTAKQVINCI